MVERDTRPKTSEPPPPGQPTVFGAPKNNVEVW